MYKKVLNHSFRFMTTFGLTYMAADLLRGENGRLLVSEVSSLWGRGALTRSYPSALTVFKNTGKSWEPTKYTGGTHFELLAKMILEGDFE